MYNIQNLDRFYSIVEKLFTLNEEKKQWENRLSKGQRRKVGSKRIIHECEENIEIINKKIREIQNS